MKERSYQIVKFLLSKNDFVTINNIAESLNVSNKTIRNDLKEIGDFLYDNQLELLKQPGSGVMIVGSKENKVSLLAKYKNHLSFKVDYSPEARLLYIALTILSSNKSILSAHKFIKDLYVSKATINNDIKQVDQLFNSFKVTLNKNNFTVSGKEKNIRNVLVHCLSLSNGFKTFTEIIRSNQFKPTNQPVFDGLEYTDSEIFELIYNLKNQEQESLPKEFPALVVFMTRLFANIIRIDLNKLIHLSQNFMLELANEPGYQQATNILHNIYGDDVSEEEIRYLQIYLFSSQHNLPVSDNDKQLATMITKQLIEDWSNQLEIDLFKSNHLEKDLIEHLTPAMTRFRHEISVDNPLLTQIADQYPNEFKLILQSQEIINNHFESVVTLNELSYLTIHLVNALNEFKEPLKVFIINNTGFGTSKLLEQTISHSIPEVSIEGIIDYVNFDEKKIENIELILSTLPLNIEKSIPVIVIDSILIPQNLLRLRQILTEHYNQKNIKFIPH